MSSRTGPTHWRRSSICANGNCVEVAETDDGLILVRDSKDPDASPMSFTRVEWRDFVAGVKRGEFD